MKNLFVRKLDESYNTNYLTSLESKLTIDSLINWTFKKTLILFEKKYEKEFLYYRFFILKKWVDANENFDKYYLETLNKIIESLGLKDYLNAEENNYLYFLQSYVFTSYRNIKTLITDFPLNKNELIFFHYDITNLSYVVGNKIKKIQNIFEMYFGDQRFVFTGYIEIVYFNISDIKQIEFNNDFIVFFTNNQKYIVKSTNTKIIEISIKRLYKILKLGEVWMNS